MKQHIVMQEYREAWNNEIDVNNDSAWIVTEAEIERLAIEWGMDKAELMEQVKEA